MTMLAWGSAAATLPGQTSSGDRGVVVSFPGGALVAVIDGLGHGRDACDAALAAERVLLAAPYAPVVELVERCHEALRGSRGAVMTVASFDAEHATMTWLGVGNVDAVLVRGSPGAADEAVAIRGGTIGYMLPPLTPRTLEVRDGDTLVLATDGIRHGFKAEVLSAREPQYIANEILRLFGKPQDDACVVVARYGGAADTRRIDVEEEADVAQARIRTRDLAGLVGFTPPAIEGLATAVSELARNILVHARSGEIVLGRTAERAGVSVVARDLGPGIADVELAIQDNFTTATGMGCGLPAVRRLVDRFELTSTVGVGTVVTIEKWRS